KEPLEERARRRRCLRGERARGRGADGDRREAERLVACGGRRTLALPRADELAFEVGRLGIFEQTAGIAHRVSPDWSSRAAVLKSSRARRRRDATVPGATSSSFEISAIV